MSTVDMHVLVEAFASYLREELMRQPSTVKRYVAVVDEFSGFLATLTQSEVAPLEIVEKSHLVRFLRRENQGLPEPSKSAWNIRLASLRSFYEFLRRTEVVKVNPTEMIDRQKARAKEPAPLSLDEYLLLVDSMERSPEQYRSRNVAIVQVFFHCALRVTELASLDLGNVDFDNYLFRDVRTKGDKRLSVPFNDLVAASLERYLKERAVFEPKPGEEALFLSNRGTRVAVRTVEYLIWQHAITAGITRPVGPHLLRHSGATELADMGTPLRVVQEICGHSSVTTTQRYVHAKGAARRKAIDDLGHLVAKRARQRKDSAKRVGESCV